MTTIDPRAVFLAKPTDAVTNCINCARSPMDSMELILVVAYELDLRCPRRRELPAATGTEMNTCGMLALEVDAIVADAMCVWICLP